MDTLHVLINAGASLEAQNGNGVTALHLTIQSGHTRMLLELINAGASVFQTGIGSVPLVIAAKCRCLQITQELIKAGESVNARDQVGSLPLGTAARSNHLRITQELIKAGSSLNAQDGVKKATDTFDEYGHQYIPLNLDGDTALHLAIRAENTVIMHELLNGRASLNVQNMHGDTPLHLAVRSGHTTIMHELINKGASLNVQNMRGETSVLVAALQYSFRDHLQTTTDNIVALIKAGASLSRQMQDGRTLLPLILRSSVREFDFKVIHLLLHVGYTNRRDDAWPNANTLPTELTAATELLLHFREQLVSVPTLRQCCRDSLRSYLDQLPRVSSTGQLIDGLPIPSSLKDFLVFKDLPI